MFDFEKLDVRKSPPYSYMTRNPITVWIALSFCLWIIGSVWRFANPEDDVGLLIYFLGWVSTLLAVGYYSTPDNSIYGKVAFGAVVVIVMGIVFKVLHFLGGNEIIVVGLLGVCTTYVTRWVREKKVF